jgi:hypothetical protein
VSKCSEYYFLSTSVSSFKSNIGLNLLLKWECAIQILKLYYYFQAPILA